MGTQFRKSVHAGPFRATISKSGVSASIGVKGYRVTKNSSGKTRTTVSIPGSGLSYVSESSSKRTSSETDSSDYVYTQKVASSAEETTFSTSENTNSSLPPKKPLIDRIFKPVMITCAILIALSGGILFL